MHYAPHYHNEKDTIFSLPGEKNTPSQISSSKQYCSQKAFVADDIGTASIFERKRYFHKVLAHRLVAFAFLVVATVAVAVGAAAATVAVAALVAAAAVEPVAMVGGTGDIVAVASAFVAEARFGTVDFGLVVVVAAAAAIYPVSEATDVKSAAAKHHPALNLI